MAFFYILIVISLLLSSTSPSPLSLSYYTHSCPSFHRTLQQTTSDHQISRPATAGAALRLFFHDCFVSGCDASTLITTSTTITAAPAERDADINLSLPGDGFDVVVRAKAALEIDCPGVVSCADILAVAVRNLVVITGGPYYDVPLGRRDAVISTAVGVEGQLPRPNMTVDVMASIFAKHHFSIQEMVVLSGAHTIGFSHCKEFAKGIYNYTDNGSGSRYDPTYNQRLAAGLDQACKNYQADPTISVFNDIMTPNKFDNMYFRNLPRGLGILRSDRVLYVDPRTRPFVEKYAKDQDAFFKDFAKAMKKLSLVGVKVGREGEIRRRCDAFNNIET